MLPFSSQALKTGHDNNAVFVQIGAYSLFVYADDARFGESAVGEYLDLCAGVALGFEPLFLQCHGEQPDGDLLTGRDDHIQFARIRMLLYLMSERHETIGLAAHRGDNHHHLMPECLEFCDASRDVLDAFRTADRCSAVLLNYECHVFSMPDLKSGAILAQLAEKNEATKSQ